MNVRDVCLVQYLRHSGSPTKTIDIKLSLNDDEINYYICRHADAAAEVKEDFELLTQDGQNLPCLAIIRSPPPQIHPDVANISHRYPEWICMP